MFISRVKVTNFRSLNSCEVTLGRYTAFVGLNDSGKSNFLRALNLFFNGETDSNHPLNFDLDFSQTAKVVKGKAREIRIEIELAPPSNYADNAPVIWLKTFRADSDGPRQDTITRKDGKDFKKSSRVDYWARHLAYEYVPAIRGDAFFKVLKRRLYQSLASSVGPKLTAASGTFLSQLRQELKRIETESKRLINLSTEFSLPHDLGAFFETLDFEASDEHTKTGLNYRGDGIQGRHIPVILKFLADQRKKGSTNGRPASETIWGFEEPENNLELIKQVEMAEEFQLYSNFVQIVTSTHSPAFYGIALPDRVRISSREEGKTTFSSRSQHNSVDEQLGLMPFVQPYLKKAITERDELLASIKDLKRNSLAKDQNILFTEGPTDKLIIQSCIKSLGIDQNFEIVTPIGQGGGGNWVVGCCVARASLTDVRHLTAGLLDNDDAGKEAAKSIRSRCNAISRPEIKTFLIGTETADDDFRTLKKLPITVPLTIEEMCGAEAWEHAERNGWLEERGTELVTLNAHRLKKTQSIEDLINQLNPDLNIRRLVEYKVKYNKKRSMATHMRVYLENGGTPPESLASFVRKICDYFDDPL